MASPFGEPAGIFAADHSIYNTDTPGAILIGVQQASRSWWCWVRISIP